MMLPLITNYPVLLRSHGTASQACISWSLILVCLYVSMSLCVCGCVDVHVPVSPPLTEDFHIITTGHPALHHWTPCPSTSNLNPAVALPLHQPRSLTSCLPLFCARSTSPARLAVLHVNYKRSSAPPRVRGRCTLGRQG
eukprot:1696749-Rhodomonas_salina.2